MFSNVMHSDFCFDEQVQPTLDDGAPFEQYPLSDFVRTGLLGFLGPVRKYLFQCYCFVFL